jgi:hypothetical protein
MVVHYSVYSDPAEKRRKEAVPMVIGTRYLLGKQRHHRDIHSALERQR